MGTDAGKKYTLPVVEIGLVVFGQSRYYFEITPFVEQGDISRVGAFSFDEICEITMQLNEALKSIHENNIVHLDIKPNNIYKVGDRYVLGDFGVAKIVEGAAIMTRHVVGTDGYTAPELRLAVTVRPTFLYSGKCDYYSLGVTLASLFEGHFVYEGIGDEGILASVQSGRLPLIRQDANREQLENLLGGLCRYSPQYRFNYEDVSRWLENHDYIGNIGGTAWPRAFSMLDVEYRDEQSLFAGITTDEAHWDEGKTLLYRGYFEAFFRSFRTDLARTAQTISEQCRNVGTDKGLSIFLKKLFPPGPIAWKGYSFNGLRELGNKMVVARTPAEYGEILQNECVSHWLSNTEGVNADDETKNLVSEIEALAQREPEIGCFWFGNAFAAKRQLTICERTVSTIPQLIEAMFKTPFAFYKKGGFEKLRDRNSGADLYGFLFSFGYKAAVNEAWENAKNCHMFDKTSMLISMMDSIAVKAEVDSGIVREFFVTYGPVGIAAYTKQLLTNYESVYKAMDKDGERALDKIKKFREPTTCGTVAELFKAYEPLMNSVDGLRTVLNDNPFCITAGVYESKGVICKNLKGCFAFKIFGRLAPLGFGALIDTGKGGTT